MRTRATADYAMKSAIALDLKSNDFCHLHFWSFLSVIIILKFSSMLRPMRQSNNMLTQATGGAAPTCFGGLAKGMVIMSTYEELMIIIAIAGLIISILNMKNKR